MSRAVFGWSKDFYELRLQMVADQIEARGIRDPSVLRAMRTIRREEFVPDAYRKKAYEDRPLSIGHGQTISQPYIVAVMSEKLEVGPESKVLEIGTGSGYQTAILSLLANEVITIETVPELAEEAQVRLRRLGYGDNVKFIVSDGSLGYDSESPFDRILVAAAAPRVPTPLMEQLVSGGMLVVPVGARDSQSLVKVTRTEGGFGQETVCSCIFVPLLGVGGFEE